MISGPADSCPFNPTESVSESGLVMAGFPSQQPEALRTHLFDWYIHSGFRGCLFNKIAAKEAMHGDLGWETPVEYAGIEDIISGPAGQRVLDTFDQNIGSDSDNSLVSFIFPNVTDPLDYARLLRFLHRSDPDRFQFRPVEDRERVTIDGVEDEYSGVQFRIKTGKTKDNEDVFAYPMIYTPDSFTTFARRYDHFMIAFNPTTIKNNPETPDTFIGVDDIDLDLSEAVFHALFQRSVDINLHAHSSEGHVGSGMQYSRKLFRAHNALVIPTELWELSALEDEQSDSHKAPRIETVLKAAGIVAVSGTVEKKESEKSSADAQVPKQTRRRGHPMKQVKEYLAQQGKLNAKKPMSNEQKRLRRKKRR